MTTQPRIALDDLTSDALDALHARLDAAEARVRELEAEAARLTPNRTRYADIITTAYPALRYAADDIADHLARALETPPEPTKRR